jgi:hypothetical protein
MSFGRRYISGNRKMLLAAGYHGDRPISKHPQGISKEIN